jgi:hypothetical protein
MSGPAADNRRALVASVAYAGRGERRRRDGADADHRGESRDPGRTRRLYTGACAELLELAARTGTPVATTLNAKSAFPENHPLALGTAARTRPATVDHCFERADVILGIGTSFSRSL